MLFRSKGSGKSNYKVSADFIEGDIPTFRCSCPSRQFPCKHGLALLYEITAGKEFEIFDIPEDILEKREKKEARAAKKEEKLKKEASMSEDEKKESAKKSFRDFLMVVSVGQKVLPICCIGGLNKTKKM